MQSLNFFKPSPKSRECTLNKPKDHLPNVNRRHNLPPITRPVALFTSSLQEPITLARLHDALIRPTKRMASIMLMILACQQMSIITMIHHGIPDPIHAMHSLLPLLARDNRPVLQ